MNNNKVNISSLKRKSLASAVACIYTSLVFTPVYASDTEIYTAAAQQNTLSPSIMMMFDTSGSMGDCMTNDDSCKSPNRRIDVLKEAMRRVLRGNPATGVAAAPGYIKMGLGRFHPSNIDSTNSYPGYIAYPARPLDAFAGINPNGFVASTGATGNSDGVQASTVVSGVITIGSSNNTASEIKIGQDGSSNNAAGFQFGSVRVPKGATVTNAYIELVPTANNSGVSTWEIAAHAIGDAPAFNTDSIASRTYGQSFTYQPDAWVAGEPQTIPVTTLVNEVVNRSDWCGDHAIAFRIRDVGTTPTTRRAYSFEGAGANNDLKPKLVIYYTINPEMTGSCIKNAPRTALVSLTNSRDDAEWWSSGTDKAVNDYDFLSFNFLETSSKKNVVGLYYRNLPLASNASNVQAYLVGRPNDNYTNVAQTKIQGFKVANLSQFCSGGNSTCATATTLNGEAKTTASVLWSPPSNTLDKSTKYSIDVSSIVSEIISQSGWAVGNRMGFTMVNDTSISRNSAFRSRNETATNHVRLELNWIDPVVTDLSSLETVRDQLEAEVNKLTITGYTPLGAMYAEASRYLYGMTPSTTTAYEPRAATSTAPITYVSPIAATDQCSANYVFLLTDGIPNHEAGVKTNSSQVMGQTCTGSNEAANWDCMFKLAEYNNQSLTNGASPQPKKRIRTNTVILGPLGGTAATNMYTLAHDKGGGTYYTTTTVDALVAAMSETLDDAVELSGTIAAAGVAVNQLNRLNHLDQLYYAVFEPRPSETKWDGNLKRYKLGGNGTAILDADNLAAVESDTGLFKTDSRSFWTTEDDGALAVSGGAAAQLPVPNQRKMFTYTGALSATNVALTPIDLTNDDIQTATGVSDDAIYTNLMNWYKGYEVPSLYNGAVTVSTQRKRIGAALHSEPILINYGYTGTLADANNPSNQENYLFFSTLEGTLHAVNANTGIEKFSFIPGEKLASLKDRYDNPSAALPQFGMDLTWNVLRKDSDNSGKINTGDKVYLYGGMRMGGDNYYAIDATDLDNPKLLFAIDGGVDKYASMGQSWSKPIITNIKVGNVNKTVLVFGGGYDMRHETANEVFTGNDKGNQLYIVDAFTGDLLWFASGTSDDDPDKLVADMTFSVPSSPRAVDVNGDGLTDAIYFGDLGGQVFRVDIDNKAAVNGDIGKRVRLLAKLGQTGVTSPTSVDQRRFYEPPTVATFKDSAGNKFATVAIGSGYRSRPLNVVTDEHYFVLFDKDVTKANLATAADATLQATIVMNDLALLDMTNSLVKTNGVSVTNKMGWYVDFPASGEKSMASGLIFDSKLVFTSYSPTFSGVSNCSPVAGQTNQYVFCMPYGKLCSTTSDYVTQNIMSGVAGSPQLLVVPDDANPGKYKVTLLTGTSLNDDIFSDAGDGAASLEPTKKWREKLGN